MITSQLRNLLLLAFLFTTTLVVVLQYNSNKNISDLVKGNEALLEEFAMKSRLQALQASVHSIDNNLRISIITKDPAKRPGIDKEIKSVRASVKELGEMLALESNRRLWEKLRPLTEEKISFSLRVLDTLALRGKEAADDLINTGQGIHWNEQIRNVTNELDHTRQKYLTAIIKETDANSLRAKRYGLIMAAMAAAIILFTFLYIINHIRRQQILIAQLNDSEKKVREAAEIKEHFLANMSHEIRTPMNAIIGFTNLLQKEPMGHLAKQYASYIHSSGENLLAIINDILDLSKIEAGMMRLEKSPFSLRALIQSVQTLFLAKAEEKKLDLSYSVTDDVPDTLEGDAVRLTQILTNLISNAIKFTHHGFVRINATAAAVDGSDKILLRLTVADSGIGIAKDKLPLVFERFTQAEENTTRRFGGTGLGLSIVKQLVLLQGGDVSVSSEPGSGSFFTVEIPFEIAQAAEKPEAIQEYLTGQGPQPFIQVLVVEDNPMNQKLMAHLLEGWQMGYDLAENGRKALEAVQEKKYDVILMDVQMPEMDGYTAAQTIRDPLKIETPIIAMTAHAFAGEREKCIGFGMNDYIAKPIREHDLYRLIIAYAGTGEKRTYDLAPNRTISKSYSTINLAYLHQLSGGNQVFEQEILRQFVMQVPEELATLKGAFDNYDWPTMKNTAHSLKTTVSFLGLQSLLASPLETLEMRNDPQMTRQELETHLEEVLAVCGKAVEEAKRYLDGFV